MAWLPARRTGLASRYGADLILLHIIARGKIARTPEAELVARIKVMARIKQSEDTVREASYTDALTGLYNRRFLEKRFKEFFANEYLIIAAVVTPKIKLNFISSKDVEYLNKAKSLLEDLF